MSENDVATYPPDDLTRVGRAELLQIIAFLKVRNTEAHENLTAVQTRCTQLLEQRRLDARLALLGSSIDRGRRLHPEGADFPALLREVHEADTARRMETDARYVDELIDVAVVAIRIAWGERVVVGPDV